MTAIGPGDFVECIRECDDGIICISVGTVARVRRIGQPSGCRCRICRSCVGIVTELDDPKYDDGGSWCVDYFRPILRPKADLIPSLLREPQFNDNQRAVEAAIHDWHERHPKIVRAWTRGIDIHRRIIGDSQ